jgi:hypothetical protein
MEPGRRALRCEPPAAHGGKESPPHPGLRRAGESHTGRALPAHDAKVKDFILLACF